MKKRICVITGSRAEYGLLAQLLRELKNDIDIELQIVVTGMHLSKYHGLTYKEIERDGFKIDEKVDIMLNSDKSDDVAKSTGLAVGGFSQVYERLNPEIVVLLGDRFEILGAACAACICRLPIAHINGGEITEGAFDDAFRHAITKMSYLHFTSADEYRKRVIQLGEDPKRVFNVGALGIDNIRKMKLLRKEEIENTGKFAFNKNNVLVTFHPVTLEDNTSGKQFQNILDALDELIDTKIIFTKTNSDTNGRVINKMIDEYVLRNPVKSVAFVSMGQLLYLSTMQVVDAVIGNSSSGIIEAPSLGVGTINIGDRQKGRIRLESIINCQPNKHEILGAINKLYSDDFKNNLQKMVNPYGDGNAAVRIKDILKKCNSIINLKKKFFNINYC